MTSILSETLAPPRIATNGRVGLLERVPEVLQLLLHQEAARRLRQSTRTMPSTDACARCAAPNASLT